MNCQELNYGVFIHNCIACLLENRELKRTIYVGQIAKIVDRPTKGDEFVVKIQSKDETWEPKCFSVTRDNLALVGENLIYYIASVSSPLARAKLALDRPRCEKLAKLGKDMTVLVTLETGVVLGVVKYKGNVKNYGKCFGIQLHEKRLNSKCDGSSGGVTYFNCEPGYGIFATIDQLKPIKAMITSNETEPTSDVEKSIANIFLQDKSLDVSPQPKYEEIVTKFGEYKNVTNKSTPYIRNSFSLQNIVDIDKSAVNSNNDFDNNTIIVPDKMYLLQRENDIKKKNRNKSEINLMDAVTSTKDDGQEHKFGNKSAGTFVHYLDNGINPRKKVFNDSAFTEGKKLNERSDAASIVKYSEPPQGATNDLSIGSLVEIYNDVIETPLYGVVKWMGVENGTNGVLVGVELEEELPADLPLDLTDGTLNGVKLFNCPEKRALFVPIQQCGKDSRFIDGLPATSHQSVDDVLTKDYQIIKGCVAPLCMPTEEDVQAVCGKNRGIQGHHNSCYLDVTLFAMFTYTSVFDSLLFRPKNANDIADYEEVQRVLREEIVNPLRKNLYVTAGQVMNLRKLLDRLSSVSGLTSEEKDPEEFLNSLLAQILRAEPFLKLNSGQESFYYQLFVEKDAELTLPTVQQLFEQSFLTSNIKLKEVPSCLIVQMPRFGKSYKMYQRILPSQLLDVTDVIEECPRQCIVCGKLARFECRECFDFNNAGLASTAFCETCLKTAHRHEKRVNHKPTALDVAYDYTILENHVKPPRLYMELFAVICIETSHYVTFVKCGVGHEAPWCFFDSMADRKGERDGYNIPEMVACPDISRWLSDEAVCRELNREYPNDRYLPEHARRLLCDAYICMYQSSDVMMYR